LSRAWRALRKHSSIAIPISGPRVEDAGTSASDIWAVGQPILRFKDGARALWVVGAAGTVLRYISPSKP
jgi:hypothetical protein